MYYKKTLQFIFCTTQDKREQCKICVSVQLNTTRFFVEVLLHYSQKQTPEIKQKYAFTGSGTFRLLSCIFSAIKDMDGSDIIFSFLFMEKPILETDKNVGIKACNISTTNTKVQQKIQKCNSFVTFQQGDFKSQKIHENALAYALFIQLP